MMSVLGKCRLRESPKNLRWALTKEIEPETLKGDLAAFTTLTLTDAQKRKFVAALDGDVYEDLPKAKMALVLRLESLVRASGVRLQMPCHSRTFCRKPRPTVRTGSSGYRMTTSAMAGRAV